MKKERRKKDMDILDDMGVSKLSAKVFFKMNYSFNAWELGDDRSIMRCFFP